ncbi:Muconate cycloisomerase (plasmid) [Cupriavidus necator H850]|nr:Muconate cycloisomerase [Cupriavidus necator H850]
MLKLNKVARGNRFAKSGIDLYIPEGPGLGLQIDEEKLAFYRRDKNA